MCYFSLHEAMSKRVTNLRTRLQKFTMYYYLLKCKEVCFHTTKGIGGATFQKKRLLLLSIHQTPEDVLAINIAAFYPLSIIER